MEPGGVDDALSIEYFEMLLLFGNTIFNLVHLTKCVPFIDVLLGLVRRL